MLKPDTYFTDTLYTQPLLRTAFSSINSFFSFLLFSGHVERLRYVVVFFKRIVIKDTTNFLNKTPSKDDFNLRYLVKENTTGIAFFRRIWVASVFLLHPNIPFFISKTILDLSSYQRKAFQSTHQDSGITTN